MSRVAAGWITVPGKGKRWRTAEGEYLMQRPAGGAPGVLGALQGAWQGADRALGGWLPGGGTPSAISPVVRRGTQAASSAAKAVASIARDQVVVPAIDSAMNAGVVRPKEGMFVRYLTGTSKPMTELPPALKESLVTMHRNKAFYDEDAYIVRQHEAQTQGTRAELEAQNKEYYDLKLKRVQSQINGGADLRPDEIRRMEDLSRSREDLRKSTEFNVEALSSQERQKRLSGFKPIMNGGVGFEESYRPHPLLDKEVRSNWWATNEAVRSLGRHDVKGDEVIDRYDFNNLEQGRNSMDPESGRKIYWSASGGGPLASDLIEAGLKLGTIKPNSGYEIRAQFR